MFRKILAFQALCIIGCSSNIQISESLKVASPMDYMVSADAEFAAGNIGAAVDLLGKAVSTGKLSADQSIKIYWAMANAASIINRMETAGKAFYRFNKLCDQNIADSFCNERIFNIGNKKDYAEFAFKYIWYEKGTNYGRTIVSPIVFSNPNSPKFLVLLLSRQLNIKEVTIVEGPKETNIVISIDNSGDKQVIFYTVVHSRII